MSRLNVKPTNIYCLYIPNWLFLSGPPGHYGAKWLHCGSEKTAIWINITGYLSSWNVACNMYFAALIMVHESVWQNARPWSRIKLHLPAVIFLMCAVQVGMVAEWSLRVHTTMKLKRRSNNLAILRTCAFNRNCSEGTKEIRSCAFPQVGAGRQNCLGN